MTFAHRRVDRRLTGRLVGWATVGGLGVVLALFAAIAIAGAVSGERAAGEVRRSGELTAAYLQAQDAVSQEDAIEDAYTDDPDPALRAQFAGAARRLDAALRVLRRVGHPADRALAQEALPLHRTYASGMRRVFDALDRGDEDAAEALDIAAADPAQDRLQRLVIGAGPRYAAEQSREIDRLASTQHTILERTAVVVPIGGLLYVLLLLVFAAFRARLERSARSELERSRAQARTDELTGLGNRRGILEALDAAVEGVREGGPPAALILVDVDRFKEINDTLGHHVGDELLRQLARRWQGVLGDDATLARLGGDEFIVLVSPCAGVPGAAQEAERLIAALDDPFELDGMLVHVRASAGVVAAPDHGTDRDELLRHADVAMYRAKGGDDDIALYVGEDDAGGLDRVVLAGELHAALERGELVLHFQPKADVGTGEVHAVEALVRWAHPTRGLLLPGEFLPIAEQHGLMRRLTAYVLDGAAAQAAAWERAGRPLQIAVNLAPANLLDLRFPDEMASLIERSGVTPGLLRLEITEDTIMVDPERVLDIVARLGELGPSFALDDFGTGYSSLSYLKRLPVQELKIDRSFVMDMDGSRDDAVIVQSTVDLGRNLGLTVTAEGVETQATWDRLAAFGCHAAQGFLLSRALPADELVGWLARREARVRQRSPSR